jgi:hypothetical protein
MKVQATVMLSFQAKTFEDAGMLLDDVLARARARDDVDVGHVDVTTPPGDHLVTLPPITAPAARPPLIPSS